MPMTRNPGAAMRRPMPVRKNDPYDAERVRESVRQVMVEKGLNPNSWATKAQVSVNSIRGFLRLPDEHGGER